MAEPGIKPWTFCSECNEVTNRLEEGRSAFKILTGKPTGERP
jgi:hypothetical protein